ncbi:MAG: S-layer homology domain-containing protein [Clostridia bacterium]|nr:S-layer homology domain-containing protein [Clostridia bacterium]
MMKRIHSFILACLLFVSALSIFVYAAEQTGLTFDNADAYILEKELAATPNTFEATVYFPSSFSMSSRGGIILGNYGDGASSYFFEINTDGRPRLYWEDPDGTEHGYMFGSAKVQAGKWTHIAVVRDYVGKRLYCYVNGQLKQTLYLKATETKQHNTWITLGNDGRQNKQQYFKGRIGSVALYADVRTAEEIAKDAISAQADADLLLSCDFKNSTDTARPDRLEDSSIYGNDFVRHVCWLDSAEEPKDYAYSFAVIGDTQNVVDKDPEKTKAIYDWIVENVREKKIEFVFGLGDITNRSTEAEWKVATENIAKLDGVVPYSLVRGNHDTELTFYTSFKDSKYVQQLGGQYGNILTNTWQEFTVGDTKYLVLTLDYYPTDAELAWANSIVKSHPEHKVIVTTHAYLHRWGATIDAKCEKVWTNFVSKHENIFLVLCGHIIQDDVTVKQRRGVNGNVVTEMLIDPQCLDLTYGATGMVAMLYFSEDGNTVQVAYYSTVREQYFKECNQFTIQLDTMNLADAFTKTRDYTDGFTDVSKSVWFYRYVKAAYERGLASGTSDTHFSPGNTFTIAQALTTAANIHSKYSGVAVRGATAGESWYTPYVEYCVANGIITKEQFANYDQSITRGDMAIVFASILPEEAYTALQAGTAADITSDMACASAVKKLYQAGIVGGDAGTGNYRPGDFLKRSEACVIFTRIALENERAR